jgi:hypothetical protein
MGDHSIRPGGFDPSRFEGLDLKNPLGKQKLDEKAKTQQETQREQGEQLGKLEKFKRIFTGKPKAAELARKSTQQAKAEGMTDSQVRVKKEKRKTAGQNLANVATLGGYGRNISGKHKKSEESNPKLYEQYASYKDSIRAYLEENKSKMPGIKSEIAALRKERDSHGLKAQGGKSVFPMDEEGLKKAKDLEKLEKQLAEYEAVLQCKSDLTKLMRLDLKSDEARDMMKNVETKAKEFPEAVKGIVVSDVKLQE